MHGLHLIAELYACSGDPRLFDDAVALRELCVSACREPGLTPLGELFHQFGDSRQAGGVTGAVVLAESHLAVHTWPETKGVTLDLYVCNFSQDNRDAARQVAARLIAAFAPARLIEREIERGTPALAITPAPL
ncbi:MAG TPA: adenosylmethionine decarboxylase [Accumulibacter sp.]|nr:adenosylmethionine decarboxylase [Accumulibacter sp.]HMW18566.1 adenosylmethionine decarboxylase [Accumulibacter sp.]HMX22183.1 adenosylmethionine decarboxylase [Accumulibacter sp.]HMY07209.1 adenosylmethionine decarboxylase [Accumulibacter sp.]HNC17725.1 adenosylmethionine decarboxylase [Accumulibacter sp.]